MSTMFGHFMPYYALSCHTLLYHAMNYLSSFHTILLPYVPYYVMPCYAVSYHVITCNDILFRTVDHMVTCWVLHRPFNFWTSAMGSTATILSPLPDSLVHHIIPLHAILWNPISYLKCHVAEYHSFVVKCDCNLRCDMVLSVIEHNDHPCLSYTMLCSV